MSLIRIRQNVFCLVCLFLLIGGSSAVSGQDKPKHASLYFISDCQEPLPVEKIIRKAHNNTKGRDTLFKEIVNKNDGNVFMLGDLVGKGSKKKCWKGVDSFLKNLRDSGTKVYAVPGNHEYFLRTSAGKSNFSKRFPDLPLTGFCVRTDSVAVVMLNSNFSKLSVNEKDTQQQWYRSILDSLDIDSSVKSVIVCTHHSPFSNSKVVGSSEKVQEDFLPGFKNSAKTKLFITGHSHNLECFYGTNGKRCLVIGGGGGIDQPLYSGKDEKFHDLISQPVKPRFFYLVIHRTGSVLNVSIKGISAELSPVPEITLSL